MGHGPERSRRGIFGVLKNMLATIKTFYSFVFRKKLVYTLVIIAVITANILLSVTPYFFKLFVDAIPTLNYQNLINILLIFAGISILGFVIDIVSGWLGDIVLLEAARDAREEIFDHVQRLDFAFHSNKSTGSLISSFKRGDSAFFDMFQTFHFNFLNIFVTTIVMVTIFTRINSLIAITMVVSLVVTLIVIPLLVKNNVKKRNIFNDQEDYVSSIITDNIMNYETVKLFAKEKWEENKLSDSFVNWTTTLWHYANSFRLIDIAIGIISNLSIFITFFLALYFAVHLKISIGDFVMVIGFIGIFFPKVQSLVYGIRSIAKNYADIEKYFGLLDYTVEVKDSESPVKLESVRGEIEFKNVFHSYKDGTKNAIRDFSLKIKVGESVAFVGKSGSGKTTITKLLMRFFDPTKGEILVDGINIKDFNKSDLRSFFGVVPQEPILFNNTIAYNIGYGFKGGNQSEEGPTLSEVERVAKLANISEFIEKLPNKYETNVGERGIKLSGGQKQRLAIARMILSKPDVVIFDEATSHLDSESEKLIQESFWKDAKGKTTIVIAHRLSTIARADKIIVMEKGEIKEIGTHEELLKNKESLYSHFWNLQIKLD